ncbi:MAG: transcription antitermination factor NusB [Dehalococcoidia bacterium]|nr:transcription antitermination factor NusB [Dehalococcoidia bacterium]
MAGPRRKARIVALQALYEADLTGHPLDKALECILEEEVLPEDSAEFARELARGVFQNKEQIDAVIAKYATAFPLNQVPAVDRNIIRLAIYESLIDNRTPRKIAINEAVEMGKSFGSDSSHRFINGVLGAALAPEKAKDELPSGEQN